MLVIYHRSLKLVFLNIKVFKAVHLSNFVTCFNKLHDGMYRTSFMFIV